MLNIIISAIFKVIAKIGDIILIPIMALVNALVPNLSVNFDAIFDYLHTGFTSMPFFFKVLLIPSTCIQAVVLIFTYSLSFIIGIRSYHFIMRVYNNFKP